jgi:hypothetical protein
MCITHPTKEIRMNRNDTIRLAAKLIAQVTTIAAACVMFTGLHGWVAVILAQIAALAASEAIDHVLTDERIDNTLSSVRGFFTRMKARAA